MRHKSVGGVQNCLLCGSSRTLYGRIERVPEDSEDCIPGYWKYTVVVRDCVHDWKWESQSRKTKVINSFVGGC